MPVRPFQSQSGQLVIGEMFPATMPSAAVPRMVAGFSPGAGAYSREWSSGLFDCFDDCDTCCLTCWCPCITFGRAAEIVDRGTTSCATSGALFAVIQCLTLSLLTWAYSCTYRGRMRAQLGLPEAPCADFMVHRSCLLCALCQEYRELKAHGYEPVLGWEFNAQRAAGVAMSAPPATQGMGR